MDWHLLPPSRPNLIEGGPGEPRAPPLMSRVPRRPPGTPRTVDPDGTRTSAGRNDLLQLASRHHGHPRQTYEHEEIPRRCAPGAALVGTISPPQNRAARGMEVRESAEATRSRTVICIPERIGLGNRHRRVRAQQPIRRMKSQLQKWRGDPTLETPPRRRTLMYGSDNWVSSRPFRPTMACTSRSSGHKQKAEVLTSDSRRLERADKLKC